MSRRTPARRGKQAQLKLKLPPVAENPAWRRSNQPSDDSKGRRRRRRELEPLPQLAYVYLPSVVPGGGRHDERRRRRERLAAKPIMRSCRRRRYDGSSSSSEDGEGGSSSDGADEEDWRAPQPTTMRSQRMRSLAAMSKLQHAAATTIQTEYRLYRRRCACRNRRNRRLACQAQAFLDVFLRQELQASLVPACLLEVLRETRAEDIASAKRREGISASLAGSVLTSLLDESIRDVFQSVLHGMVGSYLAERLDLTRAATTPSRAVAADVLNDWICELVGELLPEVLSDLVSDYASRQHHELLYETLLLDQLEAVASDAIVAATLDSVTSCIAST